MRQFLIGTAMIAVLGSFALADTPHPTPEELSQLKQYDQALGCAGLAEIIWQLQKDKPTAAPIREVGIRISMYAIELSKQLWPKDKIAGIATELATKNPEDINPMTTVIFSQN